MYVEFFQVYDNREGKGYADFRINCNGARYTGTCNPNGGMPRRISKATQEAYLSKRTKRRFIRLSDKQSTEMTPRLESVLRSYVASKTDQTLTLGSLGPLP